MFFYMQTQSTRKKRFCKKAYETLPMATKSRVGPFCITTSSKMLEKKSLKKHIFYTPLFRTLLGTILEGFGDRKIHVFLLLFQKPSILRKCSKTLAVRTKIKVRTRKKQNKITKKSIHKRTRKKHRKKPLKILFLLPLGPPTPPQIAPKSPKNSTKTIQKKIRKKELCKPTSSTGRQAFWEPQRLSNYHSNDQYFLICPSSP